MPNEGRKVLLFSDSRQRAATLAHDMSNFSDYMAERPLFAIAANAISTNEELSLNSLYYYLGLVTGQKNIHLFSGTSRENFLKDCKDVVGNFKGSQKRGKKYTLSKFISDAPEEMKQIILRFFCAEQSTLYDHAISWLEPLKIEPENAVDNLDDNGIDVSDEEF